MIITVGRQTGSGGHVIARKLAENLGYKFFDKELLDMAAVESGFDKKFFENNDEKRGFFRSIFSGGFSSHSAVSSYSAVPSYGNADSIYKNEFTQDGLFQYQAEAIKKAADEGDCVFVGRTADYILRDRNDVLNIFITANLEDRVARIMDHTGLTRELAEKRISDKEKSRATYYNYYTGKKWGDSSSYDLCISTSLLGIDKTEEFIREIVNKMK